MNDKEFLESCKKSWGDPSKMDATPELLACLVDACVKMLPDLQKFDRIKRSLAYGDKLREYPDPRMVEEARVAVAPISKDQPGFMQTPHEKALLHALLGSFTEAVEKLELINGWLLGYGLDVTSAAEELGDGLFYDHIAIDLLELTPELIKQINVDKLQDRYKDGFTADEAINRDTDSEKKTMNSSLDASLDGAYG